MFTPFEGYSNVRSIAKRSAFLRYIFVNLGFNWRSIYYSLGLRDPGMNEYSKYAGNTERLKSSDVTEKSKLVIDHFFQFINNRNLNKNITFILDADRTDVYNNTNTNSYFNEMRDYMMSKAESNGVNFIDMNEVFRADFKINKMKFEFETDGHWNERAHSLAAKQLAEWIQKKH